MAKTNCWEILKCGKSHDCPASKKGVGAGTHSGENRGRFCWTVEGTLCMDEVQGKFTEKIKRCITDCEFYTMVKSEEGGDFQLQ
jgi:hypothetical protein